eukprot:14358018-Alexandrium_andersonii.AAC.1
MSADGAVLTWPSRSRRAGAASGSGPAERAIVAFALLRRPILRLRPAWPPRSLRSPQRPKPRSGLSGSARLTRADTSDADADAARGEAS